MTKPQPGFYLDEIVQTIEEVFEEERAKAEETEGLVTVEEIRLKTGLPRRKIRATLKGMKERGLIEVGKKKIVQLNDVVRRTDAYRIKSKEEKDE